MTLLNLAGQVCSAFHLNNSARMRTVQKVKDNQSRDVVTDLDIALHNISERYLRKYLHGFNLLSEEGVIPDLTIKELLHGKWLVVDPLDGSNNFAVGMPGYGYMAAQLVSGLIVGSLIVLPDQNQYIVQEGDKISLGQTLSIGHVGDNGTVYYAYPPVQDIAAAETRAHLLGLIDANSAGLYRYGSACAGLYNLLRGKHMAFIGHGIRIWDALAFMPILARHGINVSYFLKDLSITLVASWRPSFVERASQILQTEQGLAMNTYSYNDKLSGSSR